MAFLLPKSLMEPKPPTTGTIKFLCSYGGKILPRYPDGNLRYHGGDTRVLAIRRSISFSELLGKLGELCGTPVTLRCQLPTEDLDSLVSITSDEDLANLIEEYDRTVSVRCSSILKIRAFLSLPKKSSPSPCVEMPSPKSPLSLPSYSIPRSTNHCFQQMFFKPPVKIPFRYHKSARNLIRCACETSNQSYMVHSDNHWQ